MPIDNHVNAEPDGGIDHRADFGHLALRMEQVSTVFHAHRHAHHRTMPVVTQPTDRLRIVEFPLGLAPEQRHAAQHDRFAALIHDPVAFYPQRAVPLHRPHDGNGARVRSGKQSGNQQSGEIREGFHGSSEVGWWRSTAQYRRRIRIHSFVPLQSSAGMAIGVNWLLIRGGGGLRMGAEIRCGTAFFR